MINYDEDKYILEAEFSNGKTYQYFKIANNIWMDFLAVIYSGGSAGAFINKEIKPFYEYVEIN